MKALNNTELSNISAGISGAFIGGAIGCVIGAAASSVASVIAVQHFNMNTLDYRFTVAISSLVLTVTGMGIGEIVNSYDK